MTVRKSGRNMVRVYWAEISEKEIKPKAQSEWARRLFETALQREYPSISSPILLQKDEKGKPFLPEYPGIYMNLSHSGRYAACAIGEKPVGIDIECRKSRRKRELVIKKFHPEEQRLYKNTEAAEQERLFHDLWVLKESFMKAEGTGLGIPLDAFYMEELQKGTGRVCQKQNDKIYYYMLYQLKDAVFSLAVSSEEADLAKEPLEVFL